METNVVLQVCLRPGQDDDLLAWYRSLTPGTRPEAIRRVLRQGMSAVSEGERLDTVLAVLRRVETGLKIMAGQHNSRTEVSWSKAEQTWQRWQAMAR